MPARKLSHEERRSLQVKAMVTEEEKALIERWAAASGKSLSDVIRETIVKAAYENAAKRYVCR